VGLTGPGWFCNASAPSRLGSRRRRWTDPPLVALVLPLVVRAGALGFAEPRAGFRSDPRRGPSVAPKGRQELGGSLLAGPSVLPLQELPGSTRGRAQS
jgi:hypothetical protein